MCTLSVLMHLAGGEEAENSGAFFKYSWSHTLLSSSCFLNLSFKTYSMAFTSWFVVRSTCMGQQLGSFSTDRSSTKPHRYSKSLRWHFEDLRFKLAARAYCMGWHILAKPSRR